MRAGRIAKMAGIVLVGLVVLTIAAVLLVLPSHWFRDKVRQRLVETVETATGGRVEIGSFEFDWKRLRAEVKPFVIHGTEPAGRSPLLRAESVAVELKIVSLFARDINVQSLEVAAPRVYLMVYPDGRTNVPEPKVKRRGQGTVVEDILDLAVGRFLLENGVFEVESRGQTTFDARGRNLNARFLYEPSGPRYRAELSVQPLELEWPGHETVPVGVTMALAIEKNRIGLTSARLTNGETVVDASGAVENLASPRGAFQYDARVSVAGVARLIHAAELRRGTVRVTGRALWAGSSNYTATGEIHGTGIEYRDSVVGLSGFRVDGALSAGARGVDLSRIRLAGNVGCPSRPAPECFITAAEGRIAAVALHGRDIDLRSVALTALGGTFNGEAQLRALDRYSVAGNVSGLEARRVVAVYSRYHLPWDALVSGSVSLDGSLRRPADLKATAGLTIDPAAEGAAVHGRITAAYEALGRTIDLGRSTLTLPASHLVVSGTVGRELRVHLETRVLDDLLPAVGTSAARLPVKLTGAAIFDGTVNGGLDDPHIAGRLSVKGLSYSSLSFDSLEADVAASPAGAQARNAVLSRGAMRAQFQATLGLREWEADDASSLAGSVTFRNAAMADVLALADAKEIPAAGTLNGSAQASGTVGSPVLGGDVEVLKGSYHGEPFDRLAAHGNYTARTVEVTTADIVAGPKQVHLSGALDHAPGRWDAGHLRFHVASNPMALDRFETLRPDRPGLKGTVQLTADGSVDLTAPQIGAWTYRVTGLNAEISARSLELAGQTYGNARLTATSQGQTLRAHLESDFANSAIAGDGTWRLEGDYPGSATITFSKLDFAQLHGWISAKAGATPSFAGSAEGQLRLDGPALKPEAMKAELRIPKFELAPAPAAPGERASAVPAAFILHNSSPIVATMANNVVTVESARLTGPSTDLNITGKAALQQKSPLDLRVAGRVDLALVHDFDRDFVASGALAADATIRGNFDAPQVNGRLQFENAAFNLNDFPNGISRANGIILFTGDRATIQSFSGETGGGKIALTGFAGYGGGETIFRLHARAEQVRVRYPEGVSTVANANLNLTGTSDRSMLVGTITILRTGFNLESDFSSVIARSAQPVQTPSARTGFLGGLNFDIQIDTSPDVQLQSSLTENLEVEANLHLRGTVSNPAVIGRVNVTQGQVVFYGTKFTIDQGSVAFYNPLKVEPILNVDLETKARGVDVTLTVAGPLDKLSLTPRSDPPLQFSEIVALLATGEAPTSDPTLLAQQSSAPQSWQQMGASALLGQAIGSPVAGRLQRFFGVSRLRIDPTLPGLESNNPQARLTLEQQVTPDITFTYITNITTSNPQVVRVEWALSRQWSVVALRDENGTFGLDFFFKKRF